jgi:hypothetical protein
MATSATPSNGRTFFFGVKSFFHTHAPFRVRKRIFYLQIAHKSRLLKKYDTLMKERCLCTKSKYPEML